MLWLDLFCYSGSASRIIPHLATIASKRNSNLILSDSLRWASMGRKGLRPKVRRHLGTEGRCLTVFLRTSMSASRRPYFLTPSDPARPGRGSLPSSQGQGPKRRRGEGLRRYDLVTAKVNPGAGYLDHDTEGMDVLIDTTEFFLGPLGTRPASYLRSPCRSRLTSCSYIEAYVASCSTICSRLPLPPPPPEKNRGPGNLSMRPNQRVWGFLLVFAGAAPRTSGFWKMAPFSATLSCGVSRPVCRHPSWLLVPDHIPTLPSRRVGSNGSVGWRAVRDGRRPELVQTRSQRPGTPADQAFSPRPPSPYQRLVLRVHGGDRDGQGSWSLGPVLAERLFPVDGNMNKTPSRT